MLNRRLVGRTGLLALLVVALASPDYAAENHPPPKTATRQVHPPVAYDRDGAPIATAAPRRLSSLAMGGSAWSAYHAMHGKKHHQQIANKQPPPSVR